MTTITFKQIDPARTDSSVFYDLQEVADSYELCLLGNRSFKRVICADLEDAIDALESFDKSLLLDALFETEDAEERAEIIKDAFSDCGPLSEADIENLVKTVVRYYGDFNTYVDFVRYTADMLSIITGKHFEAVTLKGCSQGDWQTCVAPAEVLEKETDTLECILFNMGSEWISEEGESLYIPICTDDVQTIKENIEFQTGIDQNDILLCPFDGYVAAWQEAR